MGRIPLFSNDRRRRVLATERGNGIGSRGVGTILVALGEDFFTPDAGLGNLIVHRSAPRALARSPPRLSFDFVRFFHLAALVTAPS